MGKNKPVKKASKTAVKVSNKKQNKANKSRKNKPSNKARNASNKVSTDGYIAKWDATHNLILFSKGKQLEFA